MLFTSAELVAQFQDYNARHGIDVASMPKGKRWNSRQDCHWPIPECLEGTELIPLLKSQHVLVDLVVSEEVQKCCFFAGHAKALMRKLPIWMDAETADFFQWLYLKWVGEANRGKGTYKDPETGATAQLTHEVAKAKGWVGINAGKGVYADPDTGQTAQLTRAEALERGWVHVTTGKGVYRDAEGTCHLTTRDEAKANGWKADMEGRAFYSDEDGNNVLITKEEAEKRGLKSSHSGKGCYINPATGKAVRVTKEFADAHGWVSPRKGQSITIKNKTQTTCPHCGKTGRRCNMSRYHFDNCKHRPHSV